MLSALSVGIILYTATEEPFMVFRASDLVLIAVLGSVVFALFVAFAVACVRGYRRLPRPSTLAKLLLGGSVLWTTLNLLYLGGSIYGYFEDLVNPRFGPWR